ncbi:hypothetical protein NPIL_138411 [Nephila pilipes]|uniref:Uncharacterized protein n=1 Tax=Nephila pilipes TaxID=299642 RepID=A0A8X6UGJ9_NEPPI|nr:hypothetical protein NPIL_138411 [Nephila pilipes]
MLADLYEPRSNETKLRISIALKSEKLFRFLFFQEEPPTNPSIITVCNFALMSDDQKRLVLQNIKDIKLNSVLHIAVKTNDYSLVKKILDFDVNQAEVRNLKGKFPSDYCKSHETMDLFLNLFPHRLRIVKRNVYHSNNVVIDKFPELLELMNDENNHTILRMNEIVLQGNSVLKTYGVNAFNKISTRARDHLKNTIWHACVNSSASVEYLETLFPYLNSSIINERNVFGDTPLHVAQSRKLKKLLVKHGAHSDCLNLEGIIAYKIILNLQCIANFTKSETEIVD